jgi:hypothetical protein
MKSKRSLPLLATLVAGLLTLAPLAAAEPAANERGAALRIDPEWFIGQNEVFVYYNVLPTDGTPWQVHRARTGVAVP